MKSNFLLFSFFFLTLFSCQFKEKGNDISRYNNIYSASINFKDSIHDFGLFSGDSLIKSHDFMYTNIGNVPAFIISATPSCKCTSVEYTNEPIMPGKSGKITVIYDGSSDMSGYFNKSVKIRFNSPRIYSLKIQGKCK